MFSAGCRGPLCRGIVPQEHDHVHDYAVFQNHLRAIDRLTDHLLTECADNFGVELEDRLKELRRSAEECCRAEPEGDNAALTEANLSDPMLEHNFVVAMCSALLVFARQASDARVAHTSPAIEEALTKLWQKLSAHYRLFFAEAPPYVSF